MSQNCASLQRLISNFSKEFHYNFITIQCFSNFQGHILQFCSVWSKWNLRYSYILLLYYDTLYILYLEDDTLLIEYWKILVSKAKFKMKLYEVSQLLKVLFLSSLMHKRLERFRIKSSAQAWFAKISAGSILLNNEKRTEIDSIFHDSKLSVVSNWFIKNSDQMKVNCWKFALLFKMKFEVEKEEVKQKE